MSLITIPLDDSIVVKLDTIAGMQSRSRNDILHEAVSRYIELAEISREVENARKDIATGAVYTPEEVESYFVAKRLNLQRQL